MNIKSDIVIKVLSLGVGLAVGIVLIAKVFYELSYDSFFRNVDRTYNINTGYSQNGEIGEFGQTSGAVAPGFKAEVPGVEEATRTTYLFNTDKFLDEDGNKCVVNAVLADSCFFKVFDRPALAGDLTETLKKPLCAVISRSFADKLVDIKGDYSSLIGKRIYNEDEKDLLITIEGVYEDFPKNSSLDYGMLISMESYFKASTENWLGNERYKSYVVLSPGVDPHGLKDAIRKMQEAHEPLKEMEEMGLGLWNYLTPFYKMHTSDKAVRVQVILLSVVAFLLLFISMLNYILIVISSMVKRSKEVGVRKCYGAESRNIYGMLGKEALIHLSLSLIVAGLIIFAGRGIIESLLGVSFTTLLVPQSIIAVAVMIAVVLVVSIVVPAQLYMSVPIYAALKNFTENSRKWKLGLLGFQVLINVFMVIVMIIIARQYDMVMHSNPGYDCKDLYYVSIYDRDAMSKVRVMQTLENIPEVNGVAACYNLPFMGSSGNNVYLPGGSGELFNYADQYESTENYYDFMGIEFVAGRAPRDTTEVVVDEKFVKKMEELAGWTDGAIGKQLFFTEHSNRFVEPGKVCYFTVSGVYKSYLIGNLQQVDPRPSAMFYGEADSQNSFMPHVLFRVDAQVLPKVRQAISDALDGREIEVFSFEERLHSAYSDTMKMRNTIFIGAIFCILIALLGLVGFIRDESLRRAKEIAVRKINGAGAKEIFGVMVGDIMKLSLVMAVVGMACSYFLANKWLENFAEKITLNPIYFLTGAAVVLLIVLVIVMLNCLSIIRANPVDSLKSE